MPALSVQGPDLAIHHGDEVLDGMNAWSCEHHGASGLTARCRASTVSMQVCCADQPPTVRFWMCLSCFKRHSCSSGIAACSALVPVLDAGC